MKFSRSVFLFRNYVSEVVRHERGVSALETCLTTVISVDDSKIMGGRKLTVYFTAIVATVRSRRACRRFHNQHFSFTTGNQF